MEVYIEPPEPETCPDERAEVLPEKCKWCENKPHSAEAIRIKVCEWCIKLMGKDTDRDITKSGISNPIGG